MKTTVIVLFIIFAAQSLFAGAPELQRDNKSKAVDNLIAGIESGNTGLHSSSALVLADLINRAYLKSSDASKAIIPLLRLLSNGKTDEERIAAALALYHLGSKIGIKRLRYIAEFDDCERVAKVCRNLYYSYHHLQNQNIL
jgi:HEAT repeat protein